MVLLDGPSVAQPLRESPEGGPPQGVPVEPPDEPRRPSPLRWVALAAAGIVGATLILIGSGVGSAPANLSGITLGADGGLVLDPVEHEPVDARRAVRRARPVTFAVPVDGLPALGRADAKVTLVVVTAYGCATCEQARDLVRGLRDHYGADLRIVYKPFATPASRPGLVAACAAARQGELERFDAAVWRAPVPPDAAALTTIARDLGLDVERYAADLAHCEIMVRNSRRELDALHVGAPTYFVNGQVVEGVQSADTLAPVIEDELVKATQRIADGTPADRYYQAWVIELGRTMR